MGGGVTVSTPSNSIRLPFVRASKAGLKIAMNI